MANPANIAFTLKNMLPGEAAVSNKVYPIFESQDGIILGYSLVTSVSTLTALCESDGVKYAPGCLIICVHSSMPTTSVAWLINQGIASAPSFVSITAHAQ